MSQIYTIGHSNQSLERFLDLLKQHEIALVVDTRSYPKSKYAQQFDKDPLARALAEHSIRYEYMGRELGGRPAAAEYYDDEGHVRYARIAESAAFLGGIARLKAAISRDRVAVMCSEEDPGACHRHLLIARVLTEKGIGVAHIRGDSSLQGEAELLSDQSRLRAKPGQLALFDAPAEKPQGAAWRSIQSVSPARARHSSSER